MDYNKWVELGERMKLSGAELVEFVDKKEREYLEREERAYQRDKERQIRQMEDEAQRRRDEMDLLRLKTEMKATVDTKPTVETAKSLRPKLPKFEDGKDDMDAYIERFERFAKTQNWDESTWAVSLSSLLTGKGLEAYTSMPAEQANDYQALKNAVLKRYQLTEEGFRQKFRDEKPEAGETVYQFVARITRYFKRWVEMSGVAKTRSGLADLMIREQFIRTCSPELALFLRERTPTSVDEVVALSEQYIEAHGGSICSNRPVRYAPKLTKSAGTAQTPHSQMDQINRRRCFLCNRLGHIARECREEDQVNQVRTESPKRSMTNTNDKRSNPKFTAACMSMPYASPCAENVENGKLKLENGESLPILSGGCTVDNLEGDRNLTLVTGYVGDKEVRVLRDTGCELAAVRRDLIRENQLLDKQYAMITIDGVAKTVPAAKISVDTPYFKGELEVMAPKNLICDLIIGNVDGVSDKPAENWERTLDKPSPSGGDVIAGVVTRAQTEKDRRPLKPLHVPQNNPLSDVSPPDLKKAQRNDKTLAKVWECAESKNVRQTKGGDRYWYESENEVLYRIFEQKRGTHTSETRQIMVPTQYRARVMELAHESIVGGHLSSQKTRDRITSSFHWPGITSDVARFCRSCDICQKTIPKGRITKVPLGSMPAIDTPFHRVAIDLIGPIAPMSERGNRYILTVVDFATRYPEAVALPKIETERVAEALLDIFARVGFPSEILSDRGVQFTSDLMKEVSRLVSIKQLFTTPYNPKCNGLCERMNGVLKSMLKKMCQEKPQDWDRYLSAVLFAYREVPQASTGFAPFELLYGRTVRGPMQALKELWTGKEMPETKSTYEYVLDLRERLEETCKIARESLNEAQGVYKHHYDKSAKRRLLKVGDKVLVLLPTVHNKLQLQWQGPHEVVGVLNRMDYKVQVGKKVKTYHINLLKKYEEREVVAASVAVIEAGNGDDDGAIDDEELLDFANVQGKETWRDVQINEQLSSEQKEQVSHILQEYSDIFTDVPGTTHLMEHRVELNSTIPVRVKQYPIPYAIREDIDKEVEMMLEYGVIEETCSDYNSPVVMVKKKDGSNRFCVDFRKVNAMTRFDSEPMSNVDDVLAQLEGDKYFSKIDLAKGYWQIPVEKESRHITAFSTSKGSYAFTKMPFGMVNSGATFNRMMRKLLDGCNNADNYVDDILGHTRTWDSHMSMLREVFERIRQAKLTIRPTKCFIGFGNIGFTGHVVGNGVLKMEEDKLQKIKEAPQPKTKKQVRSFMGLAGYYRKFIPSFAQLAAPLTDLTRKGAPSKVVWLDTHEAAFNTLKDKLASEPILRLPDLSKTFILQTDASESGIGATLLQKHSDGVFPVRYASKKLLKREQNYSVTERECLSIIFGIQKFQKYLYGRKFVIQTDHAPLSYIQRSKVESGRIMRWALFLQNYCFTIEAIKGSDNVCADYLSRQ